MKFLVDADLPPLIAHRLRQLGYDCVHVREIGKARAHDQEIFELAQREGRVVVTRDYDFANITGFSAVTHHGVIRIRAHALRREALAALIVNFVSNWQEDLEHTLAILEPGYVRVRRE